MMPVPLKCTGACFMPSTQSPAAINTSPPFRGGNASKSSSSKSNTAPARPFPTSIGSVAKSLPCTAYIGSRRESPPECTMSMRCSAKRSRSFRRGFASHSCKSFSASAASASTVAAPEPMRWSRASATTKHCVPIGSRPSLIRDASAASYATA